MMGPGAVTQAIEEELRDASRVLSEARTERLRQIRKWGTPEDPADTKDREDGTGPAWMPLYAWNSTNLDRRFSTELADHFKSVIDQRAQHGTVTWRDILTEEVFEAYAEDDPEKLRTELIQVAAVAVKWIQAIDRRDRG